MLQTTTVLVTDIMDTALSAVSSNLATDKSKLQVITDTFMWQIFKPDALPAPSVTTLSVEWAVLVIKSKVIATSSP